MDHSSYNIVYTHIFWLFVYDGSVETGGLRVESQDQLTGNTILISSEGEMVISCLCTCLGLKRASGWT